MDQSTLINVCSKGKSRRSVVKLYKRIRIPLRYIYRNNEKAKSIEILFGKIRGIHFVKANPINAKVLILYDEYVMDKATIMCFINEFIERLKLHREENKNNYSNKYNEEIALAIAPELLECKENKNIWYNMDINSVQSILNTDYTTGISERSAKKRLKKIGFNVISEKRKESILKRFLNNLDDTSVKLLIGVGTISIFMGEIIDGAVIFGMVLIENFLGMMHQNKAEKSIGSLKNMIVHKALAIRNGMEMKIETKKLVPGDIILMEAGDKVPADARIIKCNFLRVNEASLTGEGIPVQKGIEICERNTELGSRNNMLYMGTNIVSGNATAVIVETGMNTEIGNIAAMLQNIGIDESPIQRKMKVFTKKLTKICFAVCIGASTLGFFLGRSLAQILNLSVSLAVGALPESLPALVTISMGLSVQRLSTKNALVRKMSSLEALGSANVICCDKTGTLTMDEMTVKNIYTDKALYKVSGIGYEPNGEISLIQGESNKDSSMKELLKAGILCSNTKLTKKNGQWQIQGDPTEGALITAAGKYNMYQEGINKEVERVKEIPFDSCRRYMTVVVKDKDKIKAYSKGAFSKIIDRCSLIYEDGEIRLFTNIDKERIIAIHKDMTGHGLRVLAFSYKDLKYEEDYINNNFIFLGIVAMEDSPRLEVKKSIEKCHKAGIKVVMITGDNKGTASSIGRQLGLLKDGLVVSGNELENMSDEELDSKVGNIQVFARTSPEQKFRIVKSFKRCGYVVAMAGDGVNDSPAIKESDIGIAMGNNGSDVAKDVADITLVNDDFSSIVRAIEEGRAVSNNIRNTTRYLLAGSIGELIAIGVCSFTGSGILPLIPIQVLWANIVCESILGVGLAVEAPVGNELESVPVKKHSNLIDKDLNGKIIRRGIGIGISSIVLFKGYTMLGFGIQKARTMAFSNLIITQMVNVYDCKNNRHITDNKYMTYSTGVSAALLGAIIYIPFIASIFGTVPLGIADAGVLAAAVSSSRI